jgi:hypothetical protein
MGITKPTVVEIGARDNKQKEFYNMLNAKHISIDIKPPADIIGDSHSKQTISKLKKMIDKIDLLFIDGDHSYNGVKADYELYAPLTKHIIAFHDINLNKERS